MSDTVTITLDRALAEQFMRREPMDFPPVGSAAAKVDSLIRRALEHQGPEPIDDKVEAFRKRFFDITGDRLQRTAVVEGLRAALGGEAERPVGEKCPECGRADCPWVMPDIDALEAAAEGISTLEIIHMEDWSRLLLGLQNDGWELRRRQPEDERESTEEGSSGAELIAAERRRQIDEEGYTPEHDDNYGYEPVRVDGGADLAVAAACYADPYEREMREATIGTRLVPRRWPWHADHYKPKDRISDLVRAGALIAAEIDRLQRATQSEQSHTEEGR